MLAQSFLTTPFLVSTLPKGSLYKVRDASKNKVAHLASRSAQEAEACYSSAMNYMYLDERGSPNLNSVDTRKW